MGQLEELQTLWQSQQPRTIDAAGAESLAGAFRRYGRRARWVFGIKLVLVAALVSWSLWRSRGSAPAIAGMLLIATMAGMLLFVDWRSQRILARLDFTGASLDFVRHSIAALEHQREPFRRYHWLFLGSLAAGENLIFV